MWASINISAFYFQILEGFFKNNSISSPCYNWALWNWLYRYNWSTIVKQTRELLNYLLRWNNICTKQNSRRSCLLFSIHLSTGTFFHLAKSITEIELDRKSDIAKMDDVFDREIAEDSNQLAQPELHSWNDTHTILFSIPSICEKNCELFVKRLGIRDDWANSELHFFVECREMRYCKLINFFLSISYSSVPNG